MSKTYALVRVQDRTTRQLYDVQIAIDMDELVRMYAQAAIDNKSRKARVANGAIRLTAEPAK